VIYFVEMAKSLSEEILDAGYATFAQSYNTPENHTERRTARAIYLERTCAGSDGE